MVLGQCLVYGIVRRREGMRNVKRVREISPQSLFLKRTETERGSPPVAQFAPFRQDASRDRPSLCETVGDAQA
jgi:hypothetical protein